MFGGKTKAQSTLEYVILIGFVVSALIAMGVYMKRGIQGKLRESTDQIGEQYSAKHTTGKYQVVTDMSQNETMVSGGETTTNIITNTQTKNGLMGAGQYEKVEGLSTE